MSVLGNSKLLVSAVSTWNNSGIKQAEKSLGKFEKNLGKLARTLGLTFSAVAVVAFGKASVKAFLADDKAAKALGQTLKNTGNIIAGKGANSFIDQLSRATGISDDQLRPALTNLLNATRSYTTSQNALNLSLDIAAGTGRDVVSVSAALSRAYSGNTTSLSKLNTGLSKAVLATGDMAVITAELTKLFKGQANVAANTYLGQMNRLGIAAKEASETIGGALTQSFVILSGGDIAQATKNIDNLAEAFANLTVGASSWFAVNNSAFAQSLKDTFGFGSGGGGWFDQMVKDFENSSLGKIYMRGATLRGKSIGGSYNPSIAKAQEVGSSAEQAKQTKLLTDKMKADKAAAALAKKTAALKLALSKGNAAFDLTSIQIQAALKQTIDEDTRKRLLLMQALQGEDYDLIKRRLTELAEFTQNADLRKLAGLKTITDAQLKALSDTLIAEVDAINKSKMSQDDKNKAILEALNKYDAAIKAQGGATADQSDNLRILQIRNIMAIATAQAIADKAKQDALELYLRTMGMNTRAITPLPGGGSFFPGGGFSPSTMGGGNGSGGTSSDWIDYSQTSSNLAEQQFGSGGTTVIAPTVLPVVLTDSQGFASAIQQQLQILARDGASTAATSGLVNQFL